MDLVTCLLPGGYVDGAGTVHQRAELIPLSGREEEFLAGNHRRESASLVTTVLSRCVRRIGGISPLTEDVVRALLVADRQYLLLKLRGATFGEQVQATMFCPWPDCGNKIDIDFSTGDIPVKASEDKGPIYRVELSPEAAFTDAQGQVHQEVTFRLPNGGDQEAISSLVHENEARALTMLLGRCVQSIGPLGEPRAELVHRLSPLARLEIERRMEALAPQVELTMEGDCPECEREFGVNFDLQEFFFGELRTSLDLLYRQVHYLAYHYHWSEREILDMPREKRHKYIEVLAEEIERLNDAWG
ncbi:MAG: hypothetical protein PVF45_06425 [Anaerolineae bacterium]|jgi:hypothetical protein